MAKLPKFGSPAWRKKFNLDKAGTKRKKALKRNSRASENKTLYALQFRFKTGKADSGWKTDELYPTKALADAALRAKGGARSGSGMTRYKVIKRLIPNPDGDSQAGADAKYQEFHGRPSTGVDDIEVSMNERTHLAQCGKLIKLKVRMADGSAFELAPKGVKLCTTPDGGQLEFVGGDQELDVSGLGLGDALPKDRLVIGECFYIEYETTKHFHDFAPVNYWHKFGEESGVFPTLSYDNVNGLLYLEGGRYQVRPEGIVD